MFWPDIVGAFSLLSLSIGLAVLFLYSPMSFFPIATVLVIGGGLAYSVLSGLILFPVALFLLLVTSIYLKAMTLQESS